MASKKTPEEKLKSSFRAFLWMIWKELNLPDPTPIQYDVAKYLQSGPRRRIIEGFRGMGKSWITAAYVLWRLYRNPQERILVVSATEDHAVDFSTFVLKLIDTIPILSHLKPPADRRSKMSFDVGPAEPAKAPSVKSVGVFGQLQGPRATLIVADDIETLGNAETPGKRRKLARVISEFDSIIVPGGEVVFLGTPQYEASVYNALYAKKTPQGGRLYDCRIWPALVPNDGEAEAYGGRLAPIISEMRKDRSRIGHTSDPDRFSDIDLEERSVSYGRTGFRLQFMLDTTLSDEDRYPLKLTDCVVMSLDKLQGPDRVVWGPTSDNELKDLVNLGRDADRIHGPAMGHMASYQPWDESILVVDPSGRGKDETAWTVLKSLNGVFFVAHIDCDQNGYEESVIERMARAAKDHQCSMCVFEGNFGDGMWEKIASPIFARIHPITFEEVKHYGISKERRIIDTLEPVMNAHKLVFDRQVIERDHLMIQGYDIEKSLYYSLIYQMTRLTAEKGTIPHDDRLDAVAMGVAYFQNQVDIDNKKEATRKRDEALDEWLERFEHKKYSESKRFESDDAYWHGDTDSLMSYN